MALTPGQERFADKVHRATGLELPTVRAWVAAEGGPDDNPLNIMAAYPRIARYGTPDNAARATIALLRTERYRPVLAIADSGDINRELQAIATSPWEENQYRGSSSEPGNLLRGAYKTLYPGDGATPVIFVPPSTIGPQSPGGRAATKAGADVYRALRDLNWKEWAVAFSLYALFTVFALGLIVVGLMRSMGVSPTALAGMRAQPKSAQTKDIPFG